MMTENPSRVLIYYSILVLPVDMYVEELWCQTMGCTYDLLPPSIKICAEFAINNFSSQAERCEWFALLEVENLWWFIFYKNFL